MDTGVEGELPTSIDERTKLIPKIRSRRVICATLISIWGTFSFGYSLGYSSPASYDLQSNTSAVDVRLDSSEQSWFSVSVKMNESKRSMNVISVGGNMIFILIYLLFSLTPFAVWSSPVGRCSTVTSSYSSVLIA